MSTMTQPPSPASADAAGQSPPTPNCGPDEPPRGSPEWITWASAELRRIPPARTRALINALLKADGPPCKELAATLRGYFVFMRSRKRAQVARLIESPLLDSEARSWFKAEIEADSDPKVRRVLGGDPWADCPVAPALKARLRKLGASWMPNARPNSDLPPPYDRLATGLSLPHGLVRNGRQIQLENWDPNTPERPILIADSRQWVQIGRSGDYHELFLALEGDDPPIVELDHDGSDDALYPTKLSVWLRQAVAP